MNIKRSTWDKYITTLNRLDQTAAKDVEHYMTFISNKVMSGALTEGEGIDLLIKHCYAVATKYGEGSAAAACEMYDAVATLSGKKIRPAVPARTASYGDVAKAVQGTKNMNPSVTADAVSRLVKRAGADTTLKNAIRDGAEWAWIPGGDSCAFCLTLASNGWQRASKAVMSGDHADHIHAHCMCTFAIRFSSDMDVEGYRPEKLREQYYDAEGTSPQDKINAMRREAYQENKEQINEQKREAYAQRKEREEQSQTEPAQ